MKRILFILIVGLLALGYKVQAQVDNIISASGEVGNENSSLEFLHEAGGITQYPRLTDAGEMLYYAPIVRTDSISFVSTTSFTIYGNIIFNGWHESVLQQGFQYCTDTLGTLNTYYVTPSNPFVQCETPCDNYLYQATINSLTPFVTYYVRAFAKNDMGEGYGKWMSFISRSHLDGKPCVGNETLTDADGNTYPTVQIGSQCWMAENLRVMHYGNGTPLTEGNKLSTTDPYFYHVTDDESSDATYGLLYNWLAATANIISSEENPINIQGICPNGWHLPSDAEWKQLEIYLGMSPADAELTSSRGTIAAKLAGGDSWTAVATGNVPGNLSAENRNSSGFNAVAAGYRVSPMSHFGVNAGFWASTSSVNSSNMLVAYSRELTNDEEGVGRKISTITKRVGYSVRCVLGEGELALAPTVTTAEASNVTATGATCGGNVTDAGTAEVTARGVCYSTTENPTIDDAHITNGSGTGAFVSTLTGLTPETTYYVRAYATNSVGTSYGEQISFTTEELDLDGKPCPGHETLTDVDGNEYPTVQLGEQCWMAENLRTTRYQNGILLKLNNEDEEISSRYYPNGEAGNVTTYGYLYNWKAVMGDSPSSEANPSGVQGICPLGWHVPSKSEFEQLIDYVGNQGKYICGTGISKALASKNGWRESTTECTPGYESSGNNATGFNALPAGDHTGYFGEYFNLWSTTLSGETSSYQFYLNKNYSNADVYDEYNSFGFSVRCVLGEGVLEATLDGKPCPDHETVADIDGNVYKTVRLGEQCWMAENLRTTKYQNGTEISLGNEISSEVAYRYYPGCNEANVADYGYLYNWKAAVGSTLGSSYNPSGLQGICPTGWHVPGRLEIIELLNYVENQSQYVCGNRSDNINRALASNIRWNNADSECSPGYDLSSNNATGFSAMPAGNDSLYIGYTFSMWSTTLSSNTFASALQINYALPNYSMGGLNVNLLLSVRCVLGDGVLTLAPKVTTADVTAITETGATCGGNVTDGGTAEVTARGVCYSTTENPTIDGAHTTNGTGTGEFVSTITGLTAETTYYVRAYATSSVGTSYGEQISFTTEELDLDGKPCPGHETLTDVDGNEYPTVQLGEQCWMAENLRTTRYQNGISLKLNSEDEEISSRYYPNGEAGNVTTYGYLYNWKAVMGDSPSSEANPSGVQGICPQGWHVPSKSEFEQLIDYVGSQNKYICGTGISKALASKNGWRESTTACTPGYESSGNNATGFNALPAGDHTGYFGEYVNFRSTTLEDGSTSYQFYINNDNSNADVYDEYNSFGFSVRCVLGEGVLEATLDGKPCPDHETVTDIDGNVYKTVQLGEQCWMAENLRTTKYHNGAEIAVGYIGNNYTAYRITPFNDQSLVSTYGYLYNWKAATGYVESSANPSGVQGVCPQGWHIPSIAEWEQLVGYVGSVDKYVCGSNNANTARALAASRDWENNTRSECYPGYNLANNNATGFGALPAGDEFPNRNDMGKFTSFWSTTEISSGTAGSLSLWYQSEESTTDGGRDFDVSSSVRCVLGEGVLTIVPAVVTADVSEVTGTSAKCGGNVIEVGTAEIIARGVCYSTANPTIEGDHTVDGTGAGEYVSVLTGLTPETRYHVCAYVTSAAGTSYGDWMTFTTPVATIAPTVTTAEVTAITETGATCGGNVTDAGTAEVTARGICYGTSQNPTIAGAHITNGSGTGAFVSTLTGLTPETTYYVRAYATNAVGTSYGEERSFTTLAAVLPTVITTPAIARSRDTVKLGGNVIAEGTYPVTERGVCYDTIPNLMLPCIHTMDGSGVGTFGFIQNFEYEKTYYYRAYAKSAAGTAYGEELSFTLETPHEGFRCGDVLVDVRGDETNEYRTVQIGTQCWMQENLKTKKKPNGDALSKGYKEYTDNTYGLDYNIYYNWSTGTQQGNIRQTNENIKVQGLCPDGWYVPAYGDFKTLCKYIDSTIVYTVTVPNGSDKFPQTITSEHHLCIKLCQPHPNWSLSSGTPSTGTPAWATANDPSDFNASGFSALPFGYVFGNEKGEFTTVNIGPGNQCGLLTSNSASTSGGCGRTFGIKPAQTGVMHEKENYHGWSIRCIMDAAAIVSSPSVSTLNPSDVTSNTAVVSGLVVSNGGAEITEKGFYYATNGNVESGTKVVVNGADFSTTLNGLTVGTTYYYKAFATNSKGTGYGELKNFTTSSVVLPSVTTASVSDIKTDSATCGGNVTTEGNFSVTARGVCWSTSQNPTIGGAHTTNGSGLGSFTSIMTGLNANTTYYVRAYATYSGGTVYGEQKTFKTANSSITPLADCGTLVDADGNEYQTVIIGSQCWMAENLRTTKKPNGTSLSTLGYVAHHHDDMGDLVYYNWLTAANMNNGANTDIHASLQGICPDGWRLPNYDDFTTLCQEVDPDFPTLTSRPTGSYSKVSYPSNPGNEYDLAIKLSSPQYWASSTTPYTPGYYLTDTTGFNTTGLSLLPTGYHDANGYVCPGSCHIWTSLGGSSGNCDVFKVENSGHGIFIQCNSYDSKRLFAVRCLKEAPAEPTIPDVTTKAASQVKASTATVSGIVNSTGNVNITEKGFYYSTNPDVSNGTKVIVSTTDFSTVLSGLASTTTYYYKAYATNSVGTGYGDVMSFTTSQPAVLATVNITGNQNLKATSVDVNCQVVNDGGETVTERGVCWSTSANPTIANNKKQAAQGGTGAYTISIDNLTPNTTYYFRAYAINLVGTAYSGTVNMTTPDAQLPTVTTDYVDGVLEKSATAHATITSHGNLDITECGVVYDISANFTNSNVVMANTIADNFTVDLMGLNESTTYYVKAFASNALGIAYGEVVSFTTDRTFVCGDEAKDKDNNTYTTIQIGEQCWMRENLRTRKYADGTSIAQGNSVSSAVAYWYYPNNNSSNESECGLLYNWKAAIYNATTCAVNPNSIQGVCPDGWHVPSGNDWNELIKYVKGQDEFVCDESGMSIAKAIASTTGWQSDSLNCAPGYNSTDNNAADFDAKPAGLYSFSLNQTTDFGRIASFWGADNASSTTETRFYLDNKSATPFLQSYNKKGAMSVRCLRNRIDAAKVLPVVVTINASEINAHTATSGGNILNDVEIAVSSKGVCYSTQPNPTIDDAYTIDDAGQGRFVSHLSNLEQGTTYYVRAYAVNSVGVAYGNEILFTTSNPNDGNACADATTVTDIDNNVYSTVQIGSQCWMRENLSTSRYSDGTPIEMGTKGSTTKAYRYATGNVNVLGYLYNWKAVMREDESSNAIPSGVQGVCPVGWHVPSDAEWTQLTDYVNSQSEYRYGNIQHAIAKALASSSSWASPASTSVFNRAGAVGYLPSNNNLTGFNIQPAGAFYGSLSATNEIAMLWSSTAAEEGRAYYRSLQYYYAYVGADNHDVANGFSVRCLKDDQDVVLPTVTTAAVTNITANDAVGGGEVVSEGNATVTARGVCWSTTSVPTIYDAHTTDGSGMGSFVSSITELIPGTTYYVRAYATCGKQTGYGESVQFVTPTSNDPQPCPNHETVIDNDGNEYTTIQMGEQCWMKENLRTTKYADGNSIEQGSSTSTTEAYWYYPDEDANNKSTYGLLYNWKAAMYNSFSDNCDAVQFVQGVCPTGWHIPSHDEWSVLVDYMQGNDAFVCGNSNSNIAQALASNEGWQGSSNSCVPGKSLEDNNASGFGAMPAGMYSPTSNETINFNQYASFWGADNTTSTTDTRFYLSYQSAAASLTTYNKTGAMSVRCILDTVSEEAVLPTAVTFDVANVLSTSVSVSGNVYDDGESHVMQKGVCYSTQPHPTLENVYTIDGCGLGKFTSNLTGLEPGTIYYVRAYAVNSVGVAYGNEMVFMTYNPDDGTSCGSLRDKEGNSYNTVQIGGQCWMAEHLRTSMYADGTPIETGPAVSDVLAYRYTPSNSSTNGYLYNWNAVMRYDESSNAVPSGVQGVCPAGWHVPSQAEWTLFSDYVNSQSQYRYNNKQRAIGKALATTSTWTTVPSNSVYSQSGAVGSSTGSNNITGFNIKPAGAYYNQTTATQSIDVLWSSTADEIGSVYYRYLAFYLGYFGEGYHNVINGFSVRCVKNPQGSGESGEGEDDNPSDPNQFVGQNIILSEQATRTYRIYNLEDPSTPVWQWSPQSDGGYSTFNNPSDVKPAYNGTCIMCVASGGGAAIVRIRDKKVLFYANVQSSNNPHSIELLPNNRVVVASSTGNKLTVYTIDTNQVTITTKTSERYFDCGHNVVWDEGRNCLWSAGRSNLEKMSYDRTTGELTTIATYPFPAGNTMAHDFIKIHGQDLYHMTTEQHTYVFDPNDNTFTLCETPASANVKSISSGPEDYPTICAIPEPDYGTNNRTWVTKYVKNFNTGITICEIPNVEIYKLRWWIWE